MNKNELINGCLVQWRNGDVAIYMENSSFFGEKENVLVRITDWTYSTLSDYDDNLKYNSDCKFDVIKIFSSSSVFENLKCMHKYLTDRNYKIPWTLERKEKVEKEIEMEKLQEKINELQEQYNKLKNCQ